MKSKLLTVTGVFERIPLARVIVGLVFYQSGLTKIDSYALRPATIFLFENEFKVPLLPPVLAAYMATTAKLTMPWLLWSGFGARFASAALLAMTTVIEIFVYPDAYITHGLWAISLLLIMKFGAGTISVDHLLSSKLV